jgi:short-subunit dehydrogenase
VAEKLTTAGASVLVHGHLEHEVAGTAARLGAVGLVADLAAPDARARLAEQATAVHGRIDILVNNAGIGWSGPFPEMPMPHLRRLVEVDLVAPLELTRLLLPGMLERDRGALCFVSSIAGRVGVAGEAAYAAAKAGLDAFAESLRAEAAGTGIRVGVVIPTAVRTGFFDARGRGYQRTRPRPVAPETVADAVLRTLTHGAPELWVPRWTRVTALLRALAPHSFRALSHRFGEPVRLTDTRRGGADPSYPPRPLNDAPRG